MYIWVSINDHPYSINSGYLLFFETTIMEKTAELTMIQKTNIDTLHKKGKSQTYKSAVSKHIECKVDWKGIWVGKGAQATGMTASLRILSSKADSNTCESFTRSGLHAQTSSGKGLPSQF